MFKNIGFLIVILSSFVLARAQDSLIANSGPEDSLLGSSGLIYGENYAYLISAPKGWVLDNKSGVSVGSQAVFYPEGGSWNGSKAVMYVNSYDKKVLGHETRERVLSADSLNFVKQSRVKVVVQDSIETTDHRMAVVRLFEDESQYDVVAYIDDSSVVEILALSARDQPSYKEALPAFRLLVSSYVWMKKTPGNEHR